jgi:UDP-N-acetyl-D-galactosamine dehydrogenase
VWVGLQPDRSAEAKHEYGLHCLAELPGDRGQTQGTYDAIVLAVAHQDFLDHGPAALQALGKAKDVRFDVKSALPAEQVDGRL